ncbi:hypothetical protein X798_06186 [Onchocerca flexuosa]|uniref:Uncharacterized protein n=1 Tax=Onchocerca flexuosa TaxID=387005 RepID=A0A238BN26_9BILA|nr:hypothetical protein X798_06186 [Onchocerca flexuosa]
MSRLKSCQNIKLESSGSYINLSDFLITFLLLILYCIAEKSSSFDVLNRAECQQSSIIRSLSNLSFKLPNSKSGDFVDVTGHNDIKFDSLTIPFIHFGMERVTVSLSALDKEFETARCLG